MNGHKDQSKKAHVHHSKDSDCQHPNRVGSKYDENDEVEKLDEAAKGVDGDEKKSVGFEEGIAKPKGGAEERN